MTDYKTAEYFSNLIGVATVETNSIRKSNSLEGDIEEYGQKNITTTQRNLLNADEILRIPTIKLIVNLRGNKPLLLDKVIYTEHPLSKKLKDSSILEYNPKWTINNSNKVEVPKDAEEKHKNIKKVNSKKEKITWQNF